jgi:hypothetical protein
MRGYKYCYIIPRRIASRFFHSSKTLHHLAYILKIFILLKPLFSIMSSITSPRTRPRGTTATLLGDAYVSKPTHKPTVDIPYPLNSVADYTAPRIKSALNWVDQRLRSTTRKPSPLSHKALIVFKDTCCEILETTDKEYRERLIATIRTFEKGFTTDELMFRGARTPDSQSLQNQILSFKKTEFNARYGDYVASLCRELRIHTTKLRLDDFHLLAGPNRNWTTVQKEIKVETANLEDYERNPTGKVKPLTPTSNAVYSVCREAGLNPELTMYAIRQYAERNTTMHISFEDLIRDRKYHRVAVQLWKDKEDLPRIVPPDDTEAEKYLRMVIDSMIQEWFERTEDYPDDPDVWVANDKVINFSEFLRNKLANARALRDEEVRKIGARAKALKAKEDEEDEIISRAEESLKIGDLDKLSEFPEPGPGKIEKDKGKGKRLASSEISTGSKRTMSSQARLDSWNRLVSIYRATNTTTFQHLDLYGDLKRPSKESPAGSPTGSPGLGH